MNRYSIFLSVFVLGSLVLGACAAPAAAPAEPQEPQAPAATEAPAEAPQAEAPTAEAPAAAPAESQHKDVPGELPAGNGAVMGDHSTVSSLNAGRALVGDQFTLGKFERPYNANTMDVYFPHLDIVSGNVYEEASWVYARLTLVGPDTSGAFSGQYAAEVDTDLDGRGDFLMIVNHPSSSDWTTDGVQVLMDTNGDVGGENIVNTDSEGQGDGYETLAFDQGTGTDPDMAWARLSPSDANSIEMAFKSSILQGDDKYLVGFWAATAALNPALFDLNDHYTHEQAGEANEEFATFYPIKELAELDNSCRVAVGFLPSGVLPAACAGQ